MGMRSGASSTWRPIYGARHQLALLLPIGVLLVIGVAVPFAEAIRGSLFGGAGFAGPYIGVGRDPTFWVVLGRTVQTAALVAVLCVAAAYPAAEFLARLPGSVRPIAFALVIVPLWSSVIARTYSWVGVFQRDGVVDQLSAIAGGSRLMLLYSQPAVIVGMVHVLLPLVLLPTYAAVRGYDVRLSLASRSLGAGPVRTLVYVKLPALAPRIAAAGAAVFVLAMGFFVTPAILGGPRSQLLSNLVSQQIFDRYDLPRAQAMSIILFATALAALAFFAAVSRFARRLRG